MWANRRFHQAGRSRNDLVITDFKLYLADHLLEIAKQLSFLVKSVNTQAMAQIDVIAPGFTHTQHAQPITFGQELSKHSHALLRDIDRIFDWVERNNYSPFGAGALAGSAIAPEPEESAANLGFQVSWKIVLTQLAIGILSQRLCSSWP